MGGGGYTVGRVGMRVAHAPKILVGWATVNLASPIIGIYARLFSGKLVKIGARCQILRL